MVSIYAFFGSFLANNTAPTMAVNNNIEDISKGSRKSLNNTFPKLDTNPISGFFNTTGSDTSNNLNDAAKVTSKHMPAMTPMNFTRLDLRGSVSLFRLSNINTNRNNTIIAPI